MLKPLTFFLGLVPLVYSISQVYLLQIGGNHQLGADPGKALVMLQGESTIRFLLLTLMVSPARKFTGWNQIQKVRRMLGLFTYFYASLHLLAYLVLLLELDFGQLQEDIRKRPYITVGFTAYLLLTPLAITSTDRMRHLLRRRWVTLHRAIYGVAILAIIHVLWLTKSSYAEAFLYGALVLVLLGMRIPVFRLFRNGLKPEI